MVILLFFKTTTSCEKHLMLWSVDQVTTCSNCDAATSTFDAFYCCSVACTIHDMIVDLLDHHDQLIMIFLLLTSANHLSHWSKYSAIRFVGQMDCFDCYVKILLFIYGLLWFFYILITTLATRRWYGWQRTHIWLFWGYFWDYFGTIICHLRMIWIATNIQLALLITFWL